MTNLANRILRLLRIKRPSRSYYAARYGAHHTKLSKTYQAHGEAAMRGEAPPHFHRIADAVRGERILEIGAGEGMLALLLATRGKKVTALDITPGRIERAQMIQAAWRQHGLNVSGCRFVLGDVFKRLDLLDDADTAVANRVIYYFRSDMDRLFDEFSNRGVRNIVLVGNAGRNRHWRESRDGRDLGDYVYFSTREGMAEVLLSHGYGHIAMVDETGEDPIVVGSR